MLFRPQAEEPINIEDSLLFGLSQVQPESQIFEDRSDKGFKKAKLTNGRQILLKKRMPKHVAVDYSDSFLDMDKLHAQVEKRKKVREATDEVRRTRVKESAVLKSPQTFAANGVWTEKYRPSTYFQLCPAGNERQYRTVMHWLRDKQREKKILLVHGPAGVGKTSAAHCLASQAGFGTYEVNAANALDDSGSSSASAYGRQLSTLRLRMKNALFTNDVMSPGKPTCLIVDEIDCAANANDLVRVLTGLIQSKKQPVTRPIICIANDAFSGKAMEKLRPFCELVAFRRPVASSGPGKSQRVNLNAQKAVKQHLMEISEKEGLGMDRREITDVFETCEGDMRACINQMQFSGRKLDKALFVGASTVYASKDKNVSWFTLVDRLFARNLKLSKNEDALDVFDMLLSGEGNAMGSLDKVVRGCFNRYLEATHLQDDSVLRPADISDWLFYYDHFNYHSDPAGYSTLAALKFWSLFSEIDPPRNQECVIVPNAKNLDFEAMEAGKQNSAVLETFSANLPISMKLSCSSSKGFFACHFLPILETILSPDTGSARVKLTMQKHEKRNIEKIASLIKLFDMRLETTKNVETSSVTYAFGPNIDPITIYDTGSAPVTLEQKNRRLNSRRKWLFPLIKAEMDLATANNLKRVATRAAPEVKKVKRPKLLSAPDHFKIPDKDADKQEELTATQAKEQHEATRIWVKYHEGFSNAVRKNIGWMDLWA